MTMHKKKKKEITDTEITDTESIDAILDGMMGDLSKEEIKALADEMVEQEKLDQIARQDPSKTVECGFCNGRGYTRDFGPPYSDPDFIGLPPKYTCFHCNGTGRLLMKDIKRKVDKRNESSEKLPRMD